MLPAHRVLYESPPVWPQRRSSRHATDGSQRSNQLSNPQGGRRTRKSYPDIALDQLNLLIGFRCLAANGRCEPILPFFSASQPKSAFGKLVKLALRSRPLADLGRGKRRCGAAYPKADIGTVAQHFHPFDVGNAGQSDSSIQPLECPLTPILDGQRSGSRDLPDLCGI